MKREDYCLESEGRICTKASLYLKIVHHAQTGDIVHGGIYEFPGPDRPTLVNWIKTYNFDPIPDGLWNDIQDVYKLVWPPVDMTTSELKERMEEIESRGNVRKGDYVLQDHRETKLYQLKGKELNKYLFKRK